jgi:hypothetical protein
MPMTRSFLRAASMVVALAGALGCAGCVRLLQPQYYSQFTRRATLQGDQYIGRELRTGLPEPLFLRWFTRTPAWSDTLRPYILGSASDGAATTYRIGSGHRTISRVRFENGALVEWTYWLSHEESLVAYVSEEHAVTDPLPPDALARLDDLDPLSEPLDPEFHLDASRPCRIRPGDAVMALEDFVLTGAREKQDKPGDWLMSVTWARKEHPPTVGTVPAGTRLVVRHRPPVWRLHTGGSLFDPARGKVYRFWGWEGLCPAGQGVPIGTIGRLARDMVVVLEVGPRHKAGPTGYVPAFERVPIWLERIARLPAGTPVRVRDWSPCTGMRATIEPADGVDRALPGPIRVPVAPVGLFLPPPPSARPGGERPPAAQQVPDREDDRSGEQADRS